MIDHLLRFDSEDAARAALPEYWIPASDDGPGQWDGSRCIPNAGCPALRVYKITGQTTITDPETGQSYQQDIRELFSGWFINVALVALSPELRDLPSGACRIIADREAAAAGDPNFIRFVATDIEPEVIAEAHVEPMPLGARYPFGG